MDPITAFLLISVGVLVAPKIMPSVFHGMRGLFIKAYDGITGMKKSYKKRSKRQRAKEAEKDAIYKSLIKDNNMEFTHLFNSSKKTFNVTEIINFDEKKDVLYHGILRVKQPNGGYIEDDIYLFQPRVYAKDVLLGPKQINGKLYDKCTYSAKIPGTNDIYKGYVPKREFMSGRQFDYVSSSKNYTKETIKNFIDITIPQDKDGNYIPVDLTNKEELESLRQYVVARTEYGLDPDEFLDSRINAAKEAYEQWKVDTRPKYAEPIREVSESEINKVEKARKDKHSREMWQNRYYNWLAMRPPEGMGPHHMGRPMMPPPGMMGMPMHPGPMGGPIMPPPNISNDTQSRGMGRR